MVPAKETAEEQLLRMIEGPSGPQPQSAPKVSGGKTLSQGLTSFKGWFEGWRVRFGRKRPAKDRGDTFLGRLQIINRVFTLVLMALGIYLIVDWFILKPEAPMIVIESSTGSTSVPPTTEPLKTASPPHSLEDYQAALRLRNPFRLASARVVEKTTGKVETAAEKLEKLVSVLTVVGINRGDQPEALVEDAEARRTHFVQVGQQVNGLMIEAIDDRGVLVSYDGETTYLP